jgi:hypothetical protein
MKLVPPSPYECETHPISDQSCQNYVEIVMQNQLACLVPTQLCWLPNRHWEKIIFLNAYIMGDIVSYFCVQMLSV